MTKQAGPLPDEMGTGSKEAVSAKDAHSYMVSDECGYATTFSSVWSLPGSTKDTSYETAPGAKCILF